MTDELMLDGTSQDLDVFECPNCKQTIDTSSDVCRFCGAKVNHEAAQKAAHLLARVDQACSDASYLQSTGAIALILFFGAVFALVRQPRFFLLFGFQNALLGLCTLALLVSLPFPIWSLVWWRKNANLTTDDEDFQNDRRLVRTAGFTAIASLVTFGSLACLLLIFKAMHR